MILNALKHIQFQKACLLAGLFCALFISPVQAQKTAPDSLLQIDAMQADLTELRKLILETHVNPFTYTTQAEFEQAFEKANDMLTKPMSRFEFAAIVGQTLQVIGDSHSSLNLADLSGHYKSLDGRRMRLQVMKLADGVYVKDSKYEELPKGARLHTINGHSIDSLYSVSKNYGMIEGKATLGHERITDAIFPVALGWMIPLKEYNSIELALPGRGEFTQVELKAFSPEELKGIQRKERKKKVVYELKLHPDSSLAVLRIGSFSHESAGKYHRFLKKSFRKIKRSEVDHLAIDLRNNTGGNSDRMEMLFGYLTPNPPAVPSNIIARQSPTSRAHIDKQYKGLKRFVIDHFYKRNEDAINYRKMAALENGVTDTLYYKIGPKPEAKKRFNGNTYLMINGRSGSASVNFASIFKNMNLGLVLGEPCLGPESGTWGNAASAQLTNSGVKLYLSTIRYNTDNLFLVDPNPVQPDIHVEYTPADLQNNNDPVLKKVIEQINPE